MKKILVVDDEEDIRTAIIFTFDDNEYQMIEADNGAAAFDLAISERPDLIISDVMMDSGNGFALIELLKGDHRTASIPMIMMTGAAQFAGAWQSDPKIRYLGKPFSASTVLTEAQSALEEATVER